MTRQSFFSKILTTRNVGNVDRILRASLLPLALWLAAQGYLWAPVALGLGILASMLMFTALTGSCSIYYLLGFSSCPISEKSKG